MVQSFSMDHACRRRDVNPRTARFAPGQAKLILAASRRCGKN
jgi:hypothetical protein